MSYASKSLDSNVGQPTEQVTLDKSLLETWLPVLSKGSVIASIGDSRGWGYNEMACVTLGNVLVIHQPIFVPNSVPMYRNRQNSNFVFLRTHTVPCFPFCSRPSPCPPSCLNQFQKPFSMMRMRKPVIWGASWTSGPPSCP